MKTSVLIITLITTFAFSQEKPLIVAFSDMEPCAMISDSGKPYGFDIDLWTRIATKMGISYKYKWVPFKTIFSEVKNNRADLGLGAITITSKRRRVVDFTQAYLQADIKVLTKIQKENFLVSMVESIFQKNIMLLVLAVVLFAVFCGLLLWVTERKTDENKATHWWKLIFDFFYMTIVTVSTVGYGDRCARTIIGKAVVVIIILAGLVLFGCYVGTITTNIQTERAASEVKCVKDLRDRHLATIEDTYAAEVLSEENMGAKVYKVKDLPAAVKLLENNVVTAVVFDAPALLSFAAKNPGYIVPDVTVRTQSYGFILPFNSPLQHRIEIALLELQESGEYQRIYDKWLN